MDLDALQVFVEVARRGSFAAAAREQNRDPSSVSRLIALLEAELGSRLFQRSTRRLSLTEAGDVYLRSIEPLIDELERARTAALNTTGKPTGTLRLTASVSFGNRKIVPLLPEFRNRYPALKIDASFTDANLDLVADRFDLAIRLGPAIEGDLVATKLMDTHYRVVASPRYIKRAQRIAKPADLSAHLCLLFPLRAFRTAWHFRDANQQLETVTISGDVTLSPADCIRRAAIDGLGVALLPDWLVDADIDEKRLVHLLPAYAVAATNFETGAWLVYPSRAYLPNKVRVMIDFLKQHLGSASRARMRRGRRTPVESKS
jgi:DNA-binding transcriptional LysR family regulator